MERKETDKYRISLTWEVKPQLIQAVFRFHISASTGLPAPDVDLQSFHSHVKRGAG